MLHDMIDSRCAFCSDKVVWLKVIASEFLIILFAGCRIGNLLVPNDNYCKFEDWLMPILDQMLLEQNTEVGFLELDDSVINSESDVLT